MKSAARLRLFGHRRERPHFDPSSHFRRLPKNDRPATSYALVADDDDVPKKRKSGSSKRDPPPPLELSADDKRRLDQKERDEFVKRLQERDRTKTKHLGHEVGGGVAVLPRADGSRTGCGRAAIG